MGRQSPAKTPSMTSPGCGLLRGPGVPRLVRLLPTHAASYAGIAGTLTPVPFAPCAIDPTLACPLVASSQRGEKERPVFTGPGALSLPPCGGHLTCQAVPGGGSPDGTATPAVLAGIQG